MTINEMKIKLFDLIRERDTVQRDGQSRLNQLSKEIDKLDKELKEAEAHVS
jgi:hypothetical protein